MKSLLAGTSELKPEEVFLLLLLLILLLLFTLNCATRRNDKADKNDESVFTPRDQPLPSPGRRTLPAQSSKKTTSPGALQKNTPEAIVAITGSYYAAGSDVITAACLSSEQEVREIILNVQEGPGERVGVGKEGRNDLIGLLTLR